MNRTNCVIIGSGLAGIYTALQIKDKSVTLITKNAFYNLATSNSYLAQGGIAAELSKDDKSLQKHIDDTLNAGSLLNDSENTKTLVYQARENIFNLIKLGVEFDQSEKGEFYLTLEGGHSKNRILHAGGDATGKAIMDRLIKVAAKRKNIKIISESFATNLLIKDNICYGVDYLDQHNQPQRIYSSSTVIATGGLGSIYKHTTNPSYASGDGIGLVYRAQGELENMEFIQFHPTAYYNRINEEDTFLISEAVRGEGGYLLNSENKRFMSKYHNSLELAPRDIVSQSIIKEMYNTWHDCVYLDARHLGKEKLIQRFPNTYQKCLAASFKMENDLIPVKPVQHYSVGGIKTNEFGETTIKNLYASGECASTGVHGANRLASNSLLECLVFSNIIAAKISQNELFPLTKFADLLVTTYSNSTYKTIKDEIKDIMDKHVGVVRTKQGLLVSRKIVTNHLTNLQNNPNYTKHYFVALNTVTSAYSIICSALKRVKSIGCHHII